MGAIIERPGAKGRTRYYLKYIDADGTQRTKAAKGSYEERRRRARC